MDVREKLVDIVEFHTDFLSRDTIDSIVDNIIAEGVTVHEWISVKEKLPKPGDDVLVVVFDGYDTYVDMDCLVRDGKWCFETEKHKITHWQPMPKPTKGE